MTEPRPVPAAVRRRVEQAVASFRHHRKVLKAEKRALAKAVRKAGTAAAAHQFLQEVAAAVQRRVHERLDGLVNDCLRAVYDRPEEFRIVFGKRRGKTEARLAFFRKGREVENTGFGVREVAAFGLRAAALLSRKGRRRFLLLDEPERSLDPDARPRFAALLTRLAEDLKIQFVVITHHPDLKAGTVIDFGRR